MKDTLVGMAVRGNAVWVIPLTVDFVQEDNVWVATCLELGTSAYADTLAEVRQQVVEAIDLQLNEMGKLGYATDYLKQMGVKSSSFPLERIIQGRGTSSVDRKDHKPDSWIVGAPA